MMKKRNIDIIKDALYKAIKKAGFEVSLDQLYIERVKTLEHGHFATNVAMFLAGKLGKKPYELAQDIIAHIDSDIFYKVDIAGPGFINLWLVQKFYTSELQSISSNIDDYLKDTIGLKEEKIMLIDYSHPNIAKPMGVHHLLSTVIGDSIKKIYQKLGWKVIGDNFVGDMGTQFGKLIHAIKEWGNMDEIEKDPIPTLQKLYVKYHIEADNDSDMDDAARVEYKKFEDGDSESRKLWEKIVKWSKMEIQPIYDQLDIQFDEMNGESFYENKMEPILTEGRKNGVIVDGNEGAWIIKPDSPEDVPVLVRKSDGATLYMTRDLARIKYWNDEWNPDLMVNVVDVAQSFYFKQLFFAQRKLGLTLAKNVHVDFGRMQFKDGAMSTRKGNILLLADLLDEVKKRAYFVAKQHGVELEQGSDNITNMGIGAVKYTILSQARTTNLTFDWDRMLNFEGNSAPYLMYGYARANSVLKKSGVSSKKISNYNLNVSLEQEIEVTIQLVMYSDTLRRAASEFKPNHIANYMYKLTQAYNSFYNGNSIIKAETDKLKESRLLLTLAYISVMKDGFSLLGIKEVESM